MTDSEVAAFLAEIKRLNRKVARLQKQLDALKAENVTLKQATERPLPEHVYYDYKPLKRRPKR